VAMAWVAAACGSDKSSNNTGAATTAASTATTAARAATTAGGAATTGAGAGTATTAAGAATTANAAARANCKSPGVSQDTIKIGQLSALSSPAAAFYAQHQAGVKARISALNDAGGIGGRKIEIVPADTAADATKSVAAARQLVEQDNVFAVWIADSAVDSFSPYLNQQGVPAVGYNVNATWGKFDNMFGYSGNNAATPVPTTTGGKFLKSQGAEKLAVLGYAQASAQAAGEGMAKSFEAAGGQVVFKSTDAPIGNMEWTTEANQIKDSGADSLYLPIITQNALAAAAAVRQAGADLKVILFPAGYSPTTIQQAGQAAEGVYFSTDLVPYEANLPEHQAAVAAFKKYVPEAPRSQEVLQGWSIGDVLIKAIQEAGVDCPDRATLIKNMRQVHDWNSNGLLNPPVDYATSMGKPYGLCFHYVKVAGGQFQPVTNGQALCGEIIS
jgi:ABC-type branched-subunit amino acid transport system substrate-binding protein